MTRTTKILVFLVSLASLVAFAPAASAANDADSGRRAWSAPAPAAMKGKVDQDAYKIRTVSRGDASQTKSYIPLTGRFRG